MPTRSRKCEITIRFVMASSRSIAPIFDAIADVADDVTIACRTLGQETKRNAAKDTAAASMPGTELPGEGKSPSGRAQLAYTADPEAKHQRYIDVETSLKRLGLTREQLMSRTWPRGSPQHRLKRAAAHKPRANDATAH